VRSVSSALAVCLVAVALAACGSSSSSSMTSSSTAAGNGSSAPTAAEVAARVNLAKCLRGQGLNVPDPTASGAPTAALAAEVQRITTQYGVAKFQSALQACRKYVVTSFPRLALSPTQRAQRFQEALAFVRCLRGHGINLPDPQQGPNGGAGLVKALSAVDFNSPAFKAANTACANLRPAPVG
jgi:hypothetical protein